MSRITTARLGCATLAVLLAGPAFATSYAAGYNDPSGIGSSYGSPIPFSTGDIYGGGMASKTMVSAYAQATPYDGYQSGIAGGSAQVSSPFDLSALAPYATKITLQYSLQIGGIDASFGTSAVSSNWLLGYTNGFGKFVGMGGIRDISSTGKVTQSLLRYTGTGTATVIKSGFRGTFSYAMVIDPSVTPFTDILASTSCTVTEAINSGGYCNVSFGFGIPPRPANPISALTSRGGSFSGDAVPEPATWAMLLLGFGMVGTVARRRNLTPAAVSA